MMKENITETLVTMGEPEYRDFSSKLMPTVDKRKVIGIRIPILRSYAKKLTDFEDFLEDLPHYYFEENNLHAFLIEREKDFEKCIDLLDLFLPYVDNWSTCDSMKPKVLKTRPEELLTHIKRWINSKDTYTIRYGINLLMSYYLDENFKKEYLDIVAQIKSEEYYVNMMRAWFFATALAKKPDSTMLFLQNRVFDEWTYNKTIQKAIESFRISKEQKEILKKIKTKSLEIYEKS